MEGDEDLNIVDEVAADPAFVAGILPAGTSDAGAPVSVTANAPVAPLILDAPTATPSLLEDVPVAPVLQHDIHSDMRVAEESEHTDGDPRASSSSQVLEGMLFDDEATSSSSATASTVSTVSDGSGHWSDGAIEDGPGHVSESFVSVSYSDDGHDSKRKKPYGGLSRRRTRARR